MKIQKGLFFSHEDDNAGAPRALLSVLQFILENFSIHADIQVFTPKSEGVFEPLRTKHPHLVAKIIYPKPVGNNIIVRKLKKWSKKVVTKKQISFYNSYDFLFFNSMSFYQYKSQLDGITVPKFLYLHEGSNFLHDFFKDDYAILDNFTHIFVPGNQSKENLSAHGINPVKITVLPLFLDADEIVTAVPQSNNKFFTVGNLANPGFLKAPEYFLAIAKRYKEKYANDKIQFKWKGFKKESQAFNITQYEIKQAGLENFVILEEKNKENVAFFEGIDVLLMTSKQETFGRVVLEAANYSKPSMTFSIVIGAANFINEYGGFTPDYLSLEQAVDYLKQYYENRDLLVSHGQMAHEKLLEKYVINASLTEDLKGKLSIIFKK
ncbi:MAG: glycosyltransferase [Flavobacterium sp.]|nr:glycosyltransferase [Flavobacterium sp.]